MPHDARLKKIEELYGVEQVSSDQFEKMLHQEMRARLLHLRRDEDADIERVEMSREARSIQFLGYFKKVCRLWLRVSPHHPGLHPKSHLSVELKITKGARDARKVNFAARPKPDIGNRLMLARLFHVALYCVRATGGIAIVNEPADSRVRSIYIQMGFVDGECFDLADRGCVERGVEFIEKCYEKAGLQLTAEPLPLAFPGG